MNFGKDFFKILRFVMIIMKLLAETFGDDDDQKEANDKLHDV